MTDAAAALPGLDIPPAPTAGPEAATCALCGHPLTTSESRRWGMGAGCRAKLALRQAPPLATRFEVEQDALWGGE